MGTTLGAVLALALSLVLPAWAAILGGAALLVLVVANALLGRYAQQVTFLTPLIVLLGSAGHRTRGRRPGAGGGHGARRPAATGIALALWRVDQGRQHT